MLQLDAFDTNTGWRDVPGWENRYAAHPSGRIRSKRKGGDLNFYKLKGGAREVRFHRQGKKYHKKAGRVIINVFQEPISGEWATYYLDGDKSNLAVSNLVPMPLEKFRLTCQFNTSKGQYKPMREKQHQIYQNKANRREETFELSPKQIGDICSRDCFYCGKPPTYKERLHARANGIDRVDNEKGYVEENCVPCCKGCNYGKRDVSAKEYVKRSIRVANRLTDNKYRIPKNAILTSELP